MRKIMSMVLLKLITDAMDMNSGKLWEMVRDREAQHAAVHEIQTEVDTTGQLNNNNESNYSYVYTWFNIHRYFLALLPERASKQ